MSSTTNYCLKDPRGQIVGFRLRAEKLGHEIYDILDWADEHFSSHFVKQTDGQVYVYSEAARDGLSPDQIRAEPISLDRSSRDGSSDGGFLGGGPGGGPSGGGSSGGSNGGGPEGKSPVGSSGGGAVVERSGT